MNPTFWSSKRHSSLYRFANSNNSLPAISDNWVRTWALLITTQLRFSASKLTKLKSERNLPTVAM